MKTESVKKQRANFMQVHCSCGNKQTVFSNAASVVNCVKCSQVLATPTPGKAVIHAKIEKAL